VILKFTSDPQNFERYKEDFKNIANTFRITEE